MGRTETAVLWVVGLGAVVGFYFGVFHESAADRCQRVASESAQDALTPEPHDPYLRPSDADWYAEHCRDGAPR